MPRPERLIALCIARHISSAVTTALRKPAEGLGQYAPPSRKAGNAAFEALAKASHERQAARARRIFSHSSQNGVPSFAANLSVVAWAS